MSRLTGSFFVVPLRSGKDLNASSIAKFNVDQKSGKELRQYLLNIADQCEHSATDLPSVIVLDNLHHVESLGEAFNPFLRINDQQWFVFVSIDTIDKF